MVKLKIMVDLDGVIWDIMRVFLRIYNRIYNENVKYEDIDDWYYFPKERFEHVYPLTLPWIMEYPPLDEDICSYLFILNKKHDVNMLTKEANPVGILEEKLKTLDIIKGRHYGKIIRIEVIDKKVNYEADIYIDDNPCMVKDMHEFPNRFLLFYDSPWNQKTRTSGNVIRVHTWKDILFYIDELEWSKRNI